MSDINCIVPECNHLCRVDHMLRHLYTHRENISTLMPPQYIDFMLNEMKPILVLRHNLDHFCVCLHCKKGVNGKKASWVQRWINDHDTGKCLDAWDDHKHLFVLPGNYVHDAPPCPPNNVSQKRNSEDDDYEIDDTKLSHVPSSKISSTDEDFIREYKAMYEYSNDLIDKQSKIRNRVFCICKKQPGLSWSQWKNNKDCMFFLHGDNKEYNDIEQELFEYEEKREVFKEQHPHLVSEFFRRVLQTGYDWKIKV